MALRPGPARRRDHERGRQLRARARGGRERAARARGDGQRREQHRALRRVGDRHDRRRGRRDPARPAVGTRWVCCRGSTRRSSSPPPSRSSARPRCSRAARAVPVRGEHDRRRNRQTRRMDKAALAETQGPLKQQYRDDPESATVVLKADGDLDGSGIACRVQTAQAMVEAGLHPATGGSGELLCSGDMLLEALVACSGRDAARGRHVDGHRRPRRDDPRRGRPRLPRDARRRQGRPGRLQATSGCRSTSTPTPTTRPSRRCTSSPSGTASSTRRLVHSPQVSLDLGKQGATAQA